MDVLHLRRNRKRVDISGYDMYEARIYGFVSEILLDVWLEANNINYKEQNVSFMEPQNWLKKGGLFLKENSLNNRPICIMEEFF